MSEWRVRRCNGKAQFVCCSTDQKSMAPFPLTGKGYPSAIQSPLPCHDRIARQTPSQRFCPPSPLRRHLHHADRLLDAPGRCPFWDGIKRRVGDSQICLAHLEIPPSMAKQTSTAVSGKQLVACKSIRKGEAHAAQLNSLIPSSKQSKNPA